MDARVLRRIGLCLPAFVLAFDPFAMSLLLAPLGHFFYLGLEKTNGFLSFYLLMGCAFFISAQHLAQAYGRKKIMLIGLALFAISAMLAATVETYIYLLIFRSLQGIAAALVMMSSLNYLDDAGDALPHLWRVSAIVGIALAPLVSDVVTHLCGWRGVFVLEAVLMLLSFAAVLFSLPEVKGKKHAIQLLPLILWIIGLVLLALWLAQVPHEGWFAIQSTRYLLMAILVFFAFFMYERVHMKQHPKVQATHHLEFLIAHVIGCVGYIIIFAWLVLLGVYVQTILDIPVWHAGKCYLFFTIPFALSLYPCHRIAGKHGFAPCMLLGVVFSSLAMALLAFVPSTGFYVLLALSFILLGIGCAAFFYMAHAWHSTNLADVKRTRAVRLSVLWLAAFFAVSFFATFYTVFAHADFGIWNIFMRGSDAIWNYALELCTLILLILSCLTFVPAYVQWRLERGGF